MSVIVGKGSEVDLVFVGPLEVRVCVSTRSSLEVEKGRAEADSMLARDVLQTVYPSASFAKVDLLVVRKQSRKLKRKTGNILGNSLG
jgi:hypothetical protein